MAMTNASAPENWMARLARRLDVPPDFLANLHEETDDWVFVIKFHALVETAVTDTLVRHIGRQELAKEIAGMALHRKLKWTRDLGLLQAERREFVEGLSVLRNQVVHNITEIPKFSLPTAVTSMEPGLRRKLLHAWDRSESYVLGSLRFALWMFSMLVLLECEKADNSRDEQLLAEEERRFAERLNLRPRLEDEPILELLKSEALVQSEAE